MTNNQIGIYDHTTGQNIAREMTAGEKTQRDAEIVAWQTAKDNTKSQAEQLKATKIAAYQKLGLSEAEIEALLPTPKPLPVRPTV